MFGATGRHDRAPREKVGIESNGIIGARFVTHSALLTIVRRIRVLACCANALFVNIAEKMLLQASIFSLYVNAACAMRKARPRSPRAVRPYCVVLFVGNAMGFLATERHDRALFNFRL